MSVTTFTAILFPGSVLIEWPASNASGYRIYVAEHGMPYDIAGVATKGETSITIPMPATVFYLRGYADFPTGPVLMGTLGPYAPIPAPPVTSKVKIMHAGKMAPALIVVNVQGCYPTPKTIDQVPVCMANFGDGSPPVAGSFAAARLVDKPGTYIITVKTEAGIVQGPTYTVIADTRAKVYIAGNGSDGNPGTQAAPYLTLAKALQVHPANTTIYMRCGDVFPWKTQLVPSCQNVIITNYGVGALPHILYNGPRSGNPYWMMLNSLCSDVVIEQMTFDSIYNADTNYANNSTVMIAGANGVTVNAANLWNVDYGPTFNAGAYVLVQNTLARQLSFGNIPLPFHTDETKNKSTTGLRANGVYGGGGSYLFCYGNWIANSTREHCIRIDGTNFVQTAQNDLTNLDRTGIDPSDIAKGTLVLHYGDYQQGSGDTYRFGPLGPGPLNRFDLAQAKPGTSEYQQYLEELKHVSNWTIIDSANVYGTGIQFQPGTTHSMARDCLSTIWTGNAFLVNGYSGNYKRGVVDAQIINSVANITGTQGSFLILAAPNPVQDPLPHGQKLADALVVTECTETITKAFIAGGLPQGAIIQVQEADLSSFAKIAADHWPDMPAAMINYHAPGCVMAVENPSPYCNKTPQQWNAMPPVSVDCFDMPVK